MSARRSVSSVTFPVDDVTPTDSPLETCMPLEAVRALLDAPPGPFAPDASSQDNPTQGRIEACWSYALDCVAGIGHHPIVAAAHLAFTGHRPLVLSPDVIWVTIIQGFAQHVRLSPETHRAYFVRHADKRELTVERDDLHRGSPENPWADVVADFALQVRREIGDLAERFVCDFTTTGPVERAVSEVALLDVLQPYFSYSLKCICGIPAITLEGTPADWRQLREKIDLLAPYGLEWWLRELRPICDQFARAATGEVDREHWRRLYKVRAVYAKEVISGWLGKLFPYTKDFTTGTFSHRNDLLDPKVEAAICRLEAEEEQGGREDHPRMDAPGITAMVLPRGLSQVPFTLRHGADTCAMELLAGPIAVSRDGDTGALRPSLGWAVRELPPIQQAMTRLAKHNIKPARVGLSRDALVAFDLGGAAYVPPDVLRFYRDAEEAVIHGEKGVPLYRVLPLSEWIEPGWAHRWITHPGQEPMKVPGGLLRFAESSDGTELVIQLSDCGERRTPSAVFVGMRNGTPVAETGQKVARSFTDFLLRAMEGGREPYFRHAGFVPLA